MMGKEFNSPSIRGPSRFYYKSLCQFATVLCKPLFDHTVLLQSESSIWQIQQFSQLETPSVQSISPGSFAFILITTWSCYLTYIIDSFSLAMSLVKSTFKLYSAIMEFSLSCTSRVLLMHDLFHSTFDIIVIILSKDKSF